MTDGRPSAAATPSCRRQARAARARRLGLAGEVAALLLLWLKGYRLRHRRWRLPRGGELDLVMERRGEIVFVEVKTRSSDELGGALGAVGRAKRETMVRVAGAYLGRHGLWARPHRFDVVALERRGGPLTWRIRHYVDVIRDDRGRLM